MSEECVNNFWYFSLFLIFLKKHQPINVLREDMASPVALKTLSDRIPVPVTGLAVLHSSFQGFFQTV